MMAKNGWVKLKPLHLLLALLLIVVVACRELPGPQLPPPLITVSPSPATLTRTPRATVTHTTTPAAMPTTEALNATPVLDDPTIPPSPTATATLQPLGPFAECAVDEADGVTPGGPLHVLIFNDLGAWRWSDQTQTTSPVPLPPDARSPLPSPDGDRFAYTLEPEEGLVELWVMDDDGANRRQLATVSIADYLADSPEYVSDARLSYFWLADRDLLVHHTTPVLSALGDVPLEPVTIADTATGESRSLQMEGDVDILVYHPEGVQVAALSDDRVQFLDTLTGKMVIDMSLPLHNFWYSAGYSPSGDSLVIFTEEGVAIVDATSGGVETVALDYSPIGMGHYALMPPVHWLREGHSFYTITAQGDNSIDVLNPNAEFTLWRVDVQAAEVQELDTYRGALPSVRFAPDRQHIAFWSQRLDNVRTLYLANLASGEQVAYERLHTLEFLDWHPDSTRFTYWQFPERAPILGHLCQPPVLLGDLTIPFAGAIYWLGPDRYIAVEGVDRGDEVTGPWQIRLRSEDGENLLLHTVEGAAPQVRFGP